MARLVYGAARQTYEFDERTLSHVKIAIVTKLRRHESFALSWDLPVEHGSGRVSVWVSREIPLAFEFGHVNPPTLNPKWMEALLVTASRPGGMVIMPEEAAQQFLSGQRG